MESGLHEQLEVREGVHDGISHGPLDSHRAIGALTAPGGVVQPDTHLGDCHVCLFFQGQ